jgi:hypothetical protein
MKFSAKRRALLDELSALVKAVHGPKAMVVPYNLGVQLLGTGVHDCTTWDQLGYEVEQYRAKADDAATNGDKHIANIRATAEAKVAAIRAQETEDVAAMEARAERCRALLGRVRP